MRPLKRILFVFPETRYPSGQPSLGIAMLSAVARRAGADTALCDMSFQASPFEHLAAMLKEFQPDAVSITVVTPQIQAVLQAVPVVREHAPGAYLMIGGPHATVLPEETLSTTGADLVYSGEGERAMELIVSGQDPEGIPGACLMMDGKPHLVPGRLLVEDLDSLPLPDRSIFDMNRYFDTWYSMDRVDPSLKGTTIMGTRGCPYRCTFCQPTLSEIFGKKMRKRSPGSIIAELKHLKETYSIDAFMFEDSTFIVDHAWVKEICAGMIRCDLGLRWCCNVRADLLTEDLLDAMVEAGLSKVNMGVESASQRVLDDIYHKDITVDGVRRALRMCRSRGLFVQGYFMLGAPGETIDEMKKTISFAASEPFDDALFDITTPFPHTGLWEMSKELIVADYSDFDCFHKSVYRLDGITPEEIEKLKRNAFWKFYAHPARILRTLRTVLGPRNFRRTLLKVRRV
ncbi:MAG TPA: radical SAM protein [Candidatus Sabulitectum sp.]|nr:radical SAM protein [Candidatus Sabulitectum sp.]HPJ29122.1 radical SAM protein [Candidatus Sabulitectum sp.]HPR22884.1 radical SAM protein [Candidatus Sabulitectum sp.]